MAQVLFVLSSDMYVRNYVRTGVINSLRTEHSVKIIADSGLALLSEVEGEGGYLGSFEIDKKIERRRELFFSVLMWRFRQRSPTFFYRWLRMANWGLVRTDSGLVALLTSFARWVLGLLLSPKPLITAFLGSPGIFSLSSRVLNRPKQVSAHIVELLADHHFDVIVFPSAAFEPVIPDLIRFGRAKDIKTLTLIDNWDNLTSKTVYWDKPDHIAVWGEQAKLQAREIHSFIEKQIHLVGTPRFDAYFANRKDSETLSPYPFPYILFVGSAMPFDELGALHSMEKILADNPEVPDELKVVYRPHPWQQKRKVSATFNAADFQRTVLDEQISTAYASGIKQESTNRAFQPDLSYYPTLLSHARAVVGPLTTMLFEAALCLRPVLALSYPDGHHFTTNRRYLTHFEGLEAIPGFAFCDTKEQLEAGLSQVLRTQNITPSDSDAITSHYLYQGDGTYDQRLRRLLRNIVDS